MAQEESQRLKDANAEAAAQLAEARREFNVHIDQTKELMERAVQNAQKAWGENSAQATRFKQEIEDLQDRMRRLDQAVLSLQEELQRKKPKPPEITAGRVIQVDLMGEIAILDLGAREGVRTGDEFVVVSIGKGGERTPKAELKITLVEELISRADIVEQNLDDPILLGDVAERRMRPEEM